MIAIDTNIIVRFLTQDDDVQYEKAYEIFRKNEIVIPDTVIQETEWVLRYSYTFNPSDVCDAFRKLFGLENVHLQNPYLVLLAIEWYENGLGFSDAIHLAQSQHVSRLVTFDSKFIKRSKGLSKCSVVKP